MSRLISHQQSDLHVNQAATALMACLVVGLTAGCAVLQDNRWIDLPTDTDEDGVADLDDKCPLTAENSQVDEMGCSDQTRILAINNPPSLPEDSEGETVGLDDPSAAVQALISNLPDTYPLTEDAPADSAEAAEILESVQPQPDAPPAGEYFPVATEPSTSTANLGQIAAIIQQMGAAAEPVAGSQLPQGRVNVPAVPKLGRGDPVSATPARGGSLPPLRNIPNQVNVVQPVRQREAQPSAVLPQRGPTQEIAEHQQLLVLRSLAEAAGVDVEPCPASMAGSIAVDGACLPDADEDGVLDRYDQCPKSGRGLPVGPDGCAVTASAKVWRDIHFGVNSTTISSYSTALLDRWVVELREMLMKQPGLLLELAGHADGREVGAEGDVRAETRANNTLKYLVKRGLPNSRIRTRGYGSGYPIADNDTDKGRLQNRRVEIRLLQ